MPTILHYIYRDDFGGGPKALWSISRQLLDIGSQHIACKGVGKLGELAPTEPEITVHRFPESPDALFFLDSIQLLRLMRQLRPDVLMVHGQRGGTISALASYWMPQCARAYVAHFIGLYECANILTLIRNYLAEKITYSRHSWIVCLSEGNIRFLTIHGLIPDRYRIRLIPNAVEMTAQTPQVAPNHHELWSAPKKTRFLFMGRLAFQKRVDWLLLAWNYALSKGLSNAELVILGNGPLLKELRNEMDNLKLKDSVRFAGYVADPSTILASSDVLVFPSQYENHANVPLEALAAGKPIISMDADGVRETFENGCEGCIVPLGDWKAFGDKILALATDSEQRTKMGQAGRIRAQIYTPEIQGAAYRELVEDILRESPV